MPVLIPKAPSTLSKTDRSLSTYISPDIVGKIYSIFLWDMELGSVATNLNFDVTDSQVNLEHYFTVPPKKVEMSEPFATSTVPTQNGGKYSESHGSIIKTISLSGTTGVRPHKKPTIKENSTNAGLGIGLDPTEITGHDSVINLRNIFRAYSDLQVGGDSSIVMVYRNVKDDDYWIVEPLEFKLSADSSSPFSYTYQISLKTLTRFDKSVLAIITNPSRGGGDPQQEQESIMSIAARMRARQQTMTYGYYITLANNNMFKGGGITAANNILKPMQDTIKGLEFVSKGVYGSSDLLLQNAEKLAYQLREGLDSLKDLGNSAKVSTLRRYWRRSLLATYGILNERQYRGSSQILAGRRARIARAYTQGSAGRGAPTAPFTGGSSSYLGNNPVTSSVSQDVVGINDTIRSLAQRLLGDGRRWQELVVLNDLKPPYINNVPSDGVLSSGDTILFPSKKSSDIVGIRLQNNSVDYDSDNVSDSTQLLDQTYGRDLRLRDVPIDGGFSLTDIDLNQRGDLGSIVGTDNVQQAIRIKFSTEKGTMPLHPYFGAKFPIGSKATANSFNTFKLNTLTTLLSDDRIEDVKNLRFIAEGDILFVTARVQLVSSQDYINTSFAMRRF